MYNDSGKLSIEKWTVSPTGKPSKKASEYVRLSERQPTRDGPEQVEAVSWHWVFLSAPAVRAPCSTGAARRARGLLGPPSARV